MRPEAGSWVRVWFRVWFCWVTVCSVTLPVRSVELSDLFQFGEEAGDRALDPGSDSTAELPLDGALFFFDDSFEKVYINTNGFVAVAEPTAEADYLGKMPADFRMIAALLGDLDNSDGQGKVYFRKDSSPDVLGRTAEHIRQAFPEDDEVEPTSALIVTWENMAAHGTSGRGDGLDRKRNTFQLVVASMASASYAILLYPSEGLQYVSTSVGGESKTVEVGFNEGLVKGWFSWSNSPGTYYRTTTEEETSIRELTEKTNSGRRGVWVYEIGTSPFFVAITPGVTTDLPAEGDVGEPVVTLSPRQPGGQQEVEFPPYEAQTPTPAAAEEEEGFPTVSPVEYQPRYPEPETVTPTYAEPETVEPEYPEPDQIEPEYPDPETVPPRFTDPARAGPRYPDLVEPRYPDSEPNQPRYINPDPVEPRYSEPIEPRYTNPEPVQPVPPRSQPQNPQIVVVDEDLDVDVFAYNLETCANNRQKCSAFADCRDYSNGYCCHCRPGFYGNGKDCVAEGKPQRMNGKVNGRVFVGNSPSPVEFSNNDLHSYVVANDGRAYVAISSIPDSLGPSLQPLSSLGGVIGWAFALEQPGYENGFSLI
uniref:nidogen-1-like n=1 Tax=Centroberyx gerrardi TaxID=166262 RepID=UPI003AAE572C